jgi:hypothetical protein
MFAFGRRDCFGSTGNDPVGQFKEPTNCSLMARFRESVSVWLPGYFKSSTAFSSFSMRRFRANLFLIALAQLKKIKLEVTINSRYAHQCASLQPVCGLTSDGITAINRENPMMYSITNINLLSLNITDSQIVPFVFDLRRGPSRAFALLKSAQIRT